MSKVLVTGGAGYIGAHVAAELLKSGYNIRIYDDFSNGLHRRVDGKFRDIVDGDMLDRVKLLAALDGIDAVIHLAAKKSVEESVKNPLKYYENNVGGTLNLLGAMAAKGVKQLVYSSSAAVYSPNDKDAVLEVDPTAPLSPYGASKLLAEQLISSVGSAEQISNISLRYPTPDGTCIRDYIHVQDLALAHLAALKKVESGYLSQVYNVGSGKGYSVKEMMDQISKSLGRDINPEVSQARAGDSPKLIASIDKIKEQLGWSPKASLEEMIDSAWQAEVARA
jgi:UDP-glucose 4-epimerase